MGYSTDFWTWPPRSVLSFYGRYDRPLFSTKDRDTDLADALMLRWPHAQRTVIFGLSVGSSRWLEWDETTLDKVERRIRYDLAHDGYRVCIYRLFGEGNSCDTEARWKLIIRPV